MNDLPPRDHNEPPELAAHDPVIYADWTDKIEEFNSAAQQWLELKEITSKAQAERLADFLAGARKLEKDVDASRADQKRRWDALGKLVQSDYQELLSRIEKIKALPGQMQVAWLKREEERLKAEAAAARAKAEEERRLAEERGRQAASRLDAAGMADAEADLEKARKAEEAAAKERRARVGSATGGARAMSLRVTKTAKVVNVAALFVHYRNHPDVHEVLTKLANADLRNPNIPDSSIPGIEIITEEKAV